MKYNIYHWFGGKLPTETINEGFYNTIEIEDLYAFIDKYGSIKIASKGKNGLYNITITDSNFFGQK